MSYVLLEDGFHGNRKVVQVGNAGTGLYARALSYCGCELTDGFVPGGWAREVGRKQLRDALVKARLWEPVGEGTHRTVTTERKVFELVMPGEGFFIRDYLQRNPSRAEIELRRSELSAKRSEAGRKGAEKRWQTDSKEDGKRIANEWPPSPTPEVKTPPTFVQEDVARNGNGGGDHAKVEKDFEQLDPMAELGALGIGL